MTILKRGNIKVWIYGSGIHYTMSMCIALLRDMVQINYKHRQ